MLRALLDETTMPWIRPAKVHYCAFAGPSTVTLTDEAQYAVRK